METRLFACGHESPVPSRYCTTCGATGDARCPLCKSPNRREAKFCGACGTRLPDEGIAPGTIAASSPPKSSGVRGVPVTRSVNVVGASAGSGSRGPDTRGGRRDDVLSEPNDDLAGEEHEWETRRRRELFRLAAVAGLVGVTIAIAIALAVSHVGPTRRGGDPVQRDAVAVPESTPAARREQAPAPTATDPSAVPSTGDSATTAPRVATGPLAHEPADAPATPRMPDRVASPALPPRSPEQTSASTEDEAPRKAAPHAPGPAAQTSEERMADFLIEQLGAESAAAKARSTAAWYDADRSEHTFWQRVGEAIKRRSGS
jgi:hypothetical protein